jgi:hypothetical protein
MVARMNKEHQVLAMPDVQEKMIGTARKTAVARGQVCGLHP